MDYVIWLKPKTYILSKYNLYNVLSFVDLIWCVGLFCSYFLFLQSTCNHCHSLIRFLNAQSLLYRIEILNKINTLFRKWIKDITRQKVNFVLNLLLKFVLFSYLLPRDCTCIPKQKAFAFGNFLHTVVSWKISLNIDNIIKIFR